MAEHRIYPHGKIEQLAEGVWLVRGSLSFPLHRNMVIVRLPSGELVLHSVVAMDDAGMQSLEALGKPTWAIVPHPYHMMDADFYHERYPDLKFVTPAVTKEAVAARVPVAGTAEEVLPGLGFTLHNVPETRTPELIYEWPLPAGGRMLIVNDALGGANASDKSSFMGRTLMRATQAPGNRPGITRIYRMMMLRNPEPLKKVLRELSAMEDLRLVTVSHGDPIRVDCAATLRAIAG